MPRSKLGTPIAWLGSKRAKRVWLLSYLQLPSNGNLFLLVGRGFQHMAADDSTSLWMRRSRTTFQCARLPNSTVLSRFFTLKVGIPCTGNKKVHKEI